MVVRDNILEINLWTAYSFRTSMLNKRKMSIKKKYSSADDVAAGIRAQVSTATTWNSHH